MTEPRLTPAPVVIIVSGPPCTVKTTLARRIARDLRMPLLSKDGIKEVLFDTLGWSDRAWSRKLGGATMEVLYLLMESELAAGRSFLVESNFKPELADSRFAALRAKYPFNAVQIQCRTDPVPNRWGRACGALSPPRGVQRAPPRPRGPRLLVRSVAGP